MQEMQEMLVQSLGQEDLPEKETAIQSSILAWRIPRTEELGGLQATGLQRVGHDWVTNHALACASIRFEKEVYFFLVQGPGKLQPSKMENFSTITTIP